MLCPFCREKDTSVVDSRPTEDGPLSVEEDYVAVIEREIYNFERVQFQELTVIKGTEKENRLIEIKFQNL